MSREYHLENLRGGHSAVWVLARGPSLAGWLPQFFAGKALIAMNSAVDHVCPGGWHGGPDWLSLRIDWPPFAVRCQQSLLPVVRHVAPSFWFQQAIDPLTIQPRMEAVPWTVFETGRLVGQPRAEIDRLEPPTLLAAYMLAVVMGATEINFAGLDLGFEPGGKTHFDHTSSDPERTARDCAKSRDILEKRIIPDAAERGVKLLRWASPTNLLEERGPLPT